MGYRELEQKGLIKPCRARPKQVQGRLQDAAQHLTDAEDLMSRNSFDNAYRLAYDAVLTAAEALMLSKGYRAREKDHHKIVVRFTKLALGPKFASPTDLFDQMRRKRHRIYYEGLGFISREEAEKALAFAKEFVEELREIATGERRLDFESK